MKVFARVANASIAIAPVVVATASIIIPVAIAVAVVIPASITPQQPWGSGDDAVSASRFLLH